MPYVEKLVVVDYQCGKCGAKASEGATFSGQYYGICSVCLKPSNGPAVYEERQVWQEEVRTTQRPCWLCGKLTSVQPNPTHGSCGGACNIG